MSSSVEPGYELESRVQSPTSFVKSETSYRPVTYSLPSIRKSDGLSTYRDPSTYEPSKLVEGRSRIGQDRQNRFLTFYRSLSWMVGFKEKYSLILFFVCGGALLGFCLARAYMMNGKIMRAQTVPGEFRWFNLNIYRINYIIHIYLSIVGGILVGLQFLPNIRRKSVLLHRINGYTCILLLIIGNVCGGIISRRSFGGEINAQSAYYILAIMLIFAALMGYYNVKRNTRAHRKWMLRSVVYFSVVITARLIMMAARLIISNIGTYYSLWRCDEVFFVLKDANALVQQFPQCSSSDPSNNGLYVAVHASIYEGKLGLAAAVRVVQGMALWIATIIHMALVEIYIRSTESANYQRHGFVLEARDFDSDKTYSPRNSYW
ncbi:hypothetical protein FB446DRAFT_711779 [Lentinula raphanica]|nr:hypothetical protein FB446DRAFT_711779 [Lentinula raphanica]